MPVKTTSAFILFLLLPLAALAQDFPTRVKEAYALNDQNFDLACNYVRSNNFKLITATSPTQKSQNQISRDFLIETDSTQIPMSFSVSRVNNLIEYAVVFNKSHISKAKLSRREFFLAPIANQAFAQEFETNKISCSVNFAAAAPTLLQDGDYHFNVHPHTIYDWQKKLKAPIEAYLNNPSYQSLLLLESGNERGNLVDINRFFNGEAAKLPLSTLTTDLEQVPSDIPLIVSPAGNNRYQLAASSELNITFSGGNHNYCIWNNTRQVLIGLMHSKSEAKITFIYDTKAIVAQQRGMEGLSINFGRKDVNKSNLLADLLSNAAVQSGYHFSYLIFFRNLFAQQYAGMYRSFKVNYDAPGYKESFTMHGQGTRELEVNFQYL